MAIGEQASEWKSSHLFAHLVFLDIKSNEKKSVKNGDPANAYIFLIFFELL